MQKYDLIPRAVIHNFTQDTNRWVSLLKYLDLDCGDPIGTLKKKTKKQTKHKIK